MGASIKFSSRGQRQRASFSEINVTPMVDVMLVLLVIFMVTAPMMTTGVSLDLPRGDGQAMEDSDRAVDMRNPKSIWATKSSNPTLWSNVSKPCRKAIRI